MATISVVQTGLLTLQAAAGSINIGVSNNTLNDAVFNNFHAGEAGNASLWIKGAGTAGADLPASLTTVSSASAVKFSPVAATSVTNVNYMLGDGSVLSTNSTTQFSITFKANTTAGNLLFCGINCDAAFTVSSVNDSGNGNWTACGAGISNATYFQRAFRVLSAAGGACTVTITLSGTATSVEIVLMEVSAPGCVWRQDAIAIGNSTSAALTTGTFNTSGNDIVIAFTGVDNGITAIGGGYTSYPTFQMGGAAPPNVSPYADIMQQRIFTTKQTGIASTATQSPSGLYLMTAVAFVAVTGLVDDDQYPPRRRGQPAQDPGPEINARSTPAALASAGWYPDEAMSRRQPRANIAEEHPIDDRTVITKNIGWVPVDTDARGRGRAPIAEEYPIDDATATAPLSKLGWVSIDTDPRGRGRTPVAEEPLLKPLTPPTLTSIGWIGVDTDPQRRPKPPIVSESGSAQPIPFTDASLFQEENYPRQRRPIPLDSDLPFDTTQKPLASAGWYQSETLGPPRKPAPVEPDPILEKTATGSIGWISVDVEARSKLRPPVAEEPPVQKLHVLGSLGFVDIETRPRERTKPPVLEDPLLEPAIIPTTTSIGWAPDDPLPRPRERRFPDPDPLLESTKPLLPLGWIPVDNVPRERMRAPVAEEPLLEPHTLSSIGFVDVETRPRERMRAPVAEEPPVQPRHVLSGVGWMPIDVLPRERMKAPVPEEPTLERLGLLSSIGFVDSETRPREKAKAPVAEEPALEATKPLPSVGWVSVDTTPRERMKAPVPEDPTVISPAHIVVLPSIGWLEIEAPRQRRLAAPEEPWLPAGRIVPPPPPPPPPAPTPTPSGGGGGGFGGGAWIDQPARDALYMWWVERGRLDRQMQYDRKVDEEEESEEDEGEGEDELPPELLAKAVELRDRAQAKAEPGPKKAEPESRKAELGRRKAEVAPERKAEPGRALHKAEAEPARELHKTPNAKAEPSPPRLVVKAEPAPALPKWWPTPTPVKAEPDRPLPKAFVGTPPAPVGPPTALPKAGLTVALLGAATVAWLGYRAVRPDPSKPAGNTAAAPSGATIRREYVRCGREGCRSCPHGPYYRAYWREDGKVRSRYLGKKKPKVR